jgi:hypothetical protein
MDHLVQCMACGGEIGKFSCSTCGKVVGEKCFNVILGICIACAGGPKISTTPLKR